MIFDHIGIIAPDLKVGLKYFNDFMGNIKTSKIISDKINLVDIVFIYHNNIKYELISPNSKDSPILGQIKNKSNILNHIAFKVKNIDKEIIRLRSLGFIPVGKKNKALAFNNAHIIFLFSPLGYLIELIEKKS